jgi:methylmalonyl-CoA mutase, C-terminal domain
MPRPIRVLIAKPGLDGHDRGAKVVALALRDAGFEVIYTGLHQTVDEIVEAASQEDVDVIGVSVLSGAHVPIARRLLNALQVAGLGDRLVVFGGNIPARDVPAMTAAGVHATFPTGSRFDAISAYIRQHAGAEAQPSAQA